jgi:signal transduction histidine kinase
MNRLASGDFRVRMQFGRPFGNHPTFIELTDSFNKLAEELQNTEMLRTDFINNFSHEFKTPIVSIAGFAKLLKKGNLTEEQKIAYLDAIEEESLRLSYMATNVLNLTKVENQTILTDVTSYNLSEQLRASVLLLEGKWTKKEIDLCLDFEEYTIEANEELLKQVWINLIDNAVKFSPMGGAVVIGISELEDRLCVSIGNTGQPIPPDKLPRIFNKFYQADESHASEGNGIGLAIVKRVVDLHGGEVHVSSNGDMTVVTVELPKAQG